MKLGHHGGPGTKRGHDHPFFRTSAADACRTKLVTYFARIVETAHLGIGRILRARADFAGDLQPRLSFDHSPRQQGACQHWLTPTMFTASSCWRRSVRLREEAAISRGPAFV